MNSLSQTNSPTLPAPASASAPLHPAPTFVGDVADATIPNPALHSRASVKLAASAVLRGAAAFSFVPAEGIPFAERWRRIPERSPAASAGSRTSASVFIPFKAIDHRTISVAPHGAHRVVVHPFTEDRALNECADGGADNQHDDSDNNSSHFEISNPMIGVNTF